MTDRETDRPTERPRYFAVAIGRIYVILRCGLIMTIIIQMHPETKSTGTVHTSAKARMDPDHGSGSPSKSNRLFTGPLPTFPKNFVQIRSDVFAQSC